MSKTRRILAEHFSELADLDGAGDQPSTVACRSCQAVFEAMEPGMSQAHECAATVQGDRIAGHFGSIRIDMEDWSFTKGRPDWVAEGMLCDDCIERLQLAGDIQLVGQSDLTGNPGD